MLIKEKIQLPELPYSYGALAPVVSEQIMELHHGKHHHAYVTNYNKLYESLQEAQSAGDHARMIALFPGLCFNGGGHINHALFWENLAPVSEGGGTPPSGPLAGAIERRFGSFDAFKEAFNRQTAAIQGSGWGWLAYNPKAQVLEIAACANQDPLQPTTGLIPIVGVDVWEHAYYLDYCNKRPDYLAAIWQVINWATAEYRFAAATQ